MLNKERSNTMELKISIPDEVAAGLPTKGSDVSRWLLEMAAVEGYKSGKLTWRQVQQIPGFQTRSEVEGFLKQHDANLGRLNEGEAAESGGLFSPENGRGEEKPFYETASAEEWIRAFREWAESHDRTVPALGFEDVSRESIYKAVEPKEVIAQHLQPPPLQPDS